MIGSLQALEAVKVILGYGETLAGRLLLFDGTSSRFREIKLKRSAECPVCGDNPSIRELIDYDAFCGGGPAPDNSRAHEDMKVEELAERRRRNEEVLLLDVREPFEREICNLGGAFIPMNDVPNRLGELQPDRETVVYCHTGVRSARVAEYLRRNGFRNVRNLAGGIEAWARRIDPTMARY